jgi:hypothetical protein
MQNPRVLLSLMRTCYRRVREFGMKIDMGRYMRLGAQSIQLGVKPVEDRDWS